MTIKIFYYFFIIFNYNKADIVIKNGAEIKNVHLHSVERYLMNFFFTFFFLKT